jgi:serine/threonine protein kinase
MIKKGTAIATTFDEYIVDMQINQGGNGTVYLIHNNDGQVFALKVIDRRKTSTDKLKRFKNELSFCQRNIHPNIIQIYDNGAYRTETEDVVFYIMPLYAKTLRTIIDEGISPNEVLPIFVQLLKAVEFAHSKNVWHRDIKPENILIDKSNLVLADFGIAHFAIDELITAIETKKGDRLANFQYAAPEQRVKGGMVDGRADIFAAGLILNEMFTGKIIAGANYIKIGNICKEYGYLDELVDSLISQDAEKRLYPVSRILFELEVLASKENDKQLLTQLLQATSTQQSKPFFDVPQIIGFDYQNGQLIIKLDKNIPQRWYQIMQSREYSHSSTMGYEPNRFLLKNESELVIRAEANERLIQGLVTNCREWLIVVTQLFNSEIRNQQEEQKRREEHQRQADIKKSREEIQMKESLKSLL